MPPTVAVPAAAQAAARAPPPLEETIADKVIAGTIPTVAPDPELAGMPLLIPFHVQDDDAAGSVMSNMPALSCNNWEDLNANKENEEDKHENDVVEEGREERRMCSSLKILMTMPSSARHVRQKRSS
jgi:hypothetical protein